MDKEERTKIGKEAYEKGLGFEEQVAAIYRMLGFEVEKDRLLGGRQIDLVLKQHIGSMTIPFIVECKYHQVTMDIVNTFQVSLNIAKQEDPRYMGILVSNTGFAERCREAAKKLGINCVLFPDLVRSLIDFTAYVKHLVEDFKNSELSRLFIEPCVRLEGKKEPDEAGVFLKKWLSQPKVQQVTILGDYGTGKTTLARKLAHDLGIKHLSDASQPVPVMVNLREAKSSIGLENLVIHHLQANGTERASFKAFWHLLEKGFIVLIFDGFDEMVTRANARQTLDSLRELNRTVSGQAKVLLTCRTHYFRDTEEEKLLVKGEQTVGLSEGSTDLYREISNRPDFNIVYLQEFNEDQVKEYFNKIYGESGPENYRIMTGIYNLEKLSRRPVLLDMIIKSLGRMASGKKTLRPAELYDIYTRLWIDRNDWRSVLTPEQKMVFVEELAFLLWEGEKDSIHYRELNTVLKSHFKETIQQAMELEFADYEVRTATFLQRDSNGNYRFSHRSFLEFFLTKRIIRCFPIKGAITLSLRRLSPEVLGFLSDLIVDKKEEWNSALSHILTKKYIQKTSENAFLLIVALKRKLEPSKPVILPERIHLIGAQLANTSLHDIILQEANLKEANLKNSDLADSDLSYSHLNNIDMSRANLEGARLCGVNLEYAKLTGGYLVRADFTGARLDNADFTNTAFKDAKGLEKQRKEVPLGASPVNSLTDPNIKVVRSQNEKVISICYSPDGRMLASASNYKTVKVWDMSNGRPLHTFSGQSGWVLDVCFSPDSKRLAFAYIDRTVKVWDADNWNLLKNFAGHAGLVYSVCFSPNSKWMASASSDNTIRMWDVYNENQIQCIEGHYGSVYDVTFSPDSKWIASASADHTIKVWNVENGHIARTLEEHCGRVYCICFSPDNKWLASASADNTVKIWDVTSGQIYQTLTGHSGIVYSVSFSQDSRWLVSSSLDKSVKVWDTYSGSQVQNLTDHNGPVFGVCFSPNRSFFASASEDSTVKIWDALKGKCLVTLLDFDDNTWFAYTPENFFTCSDTAMKHIQFRENSVVYPAKEFEKELRRPDKIREVLKKTK